MLDFGEYLVLGDEEQAEDEAPFELPQVKISPRAREHPAAQDFAIEGAALRSKTERQRHLEVVAEARSAHAACYLGRDPAAALRRGDSRRSMIAER